MLEKERSSNQTANIPQPNDANFADHSKSLRADAKQNREQILEAARKIFAEKGLSIPIGEIARQAGVGIGTIYRSFVWPSAGNRRTQRSSGYQPVQALAFHRYRGTSFNIKIP